MIEAIHACHYIEKFWYILLVLSIPYSIMHFVISLKVTGNILGGSGNSRGAVRLFLSIFPAYWPFFLKHFDTKNQPVVALRNFCFVMNLYPLSFIWCLMFS